MEENIFSILQKVLGIYALLLIIVGTISSLISFAVCIKLSNISTFIFLAFLSISDIIALYHWNLTNFVNNWFNVDFLNYNYWLCKFGSYYQFTSLQISAWLLILISLDHNLSIRIQNWRNIYFSPKRAILSAVVLVVFFLLLNSSILFLFGLEVETNSTKTVICFYLDIYPSTRWMEQWGTAHLFLYSVIPFILLGVSNIFLLRKALESFKRKSNPSKSSAFARSILINNILFFLMTLPTAFVSYYFNHLFKSEGGRLVITLANSVSFSYHSMGFFTNFLTNLKFRNEIMRIINYSNKKQNRLNSSLNFDNSIANANNANNSTAHNTNTAKF